MGANSTCQMKMKDFTDKFTVLFDQHIQGFGTVREKNKSKGDNMEWKQRIKRKKKSEGANKQRLKAIEMYRQMKAKRKK